MSLRSGVAESSVRSGVAAARAILHLCDLIWRAKSQRKTLLLASREGSEVFKQGSHYLRILKERTNEDGMHGYLVLYERTKIILNTKVAYVCNKQGFERKGYY